MKRRGIFSLSQNLQGSDFSFGKISTRGRRTRRRPRFHRLRWGFRPSGGTFAALLICAVLLALAGLVYKGAIKLNTPSRSEYPVRGVDASHYQGEIDFDRLAEQDLQFAFIKATEGSTYVDSQFERNLPAARQSSLRVGCYHFFSYDSPGDAQAAHFIRQVPKWENMLPPVIDVEFYGGYAIHPADPETVLVELRAMVDALEEHYGLKPILYCTRRAYRLYIRDAFADCDLWIRDVYFTPKDCPWRFWQYDNRAVLDGYRGEERFIDVNVFSGSAEDFALYPQ